MHIENFDPYDFSKKEIDSVPIYYKNIPLAPCIHIRVVFNTGAFDDPVGKEGLSHFFEHLIFDGSPTLPDKKAIREWEKLHTLNTWNAWTSFYITNYWLKCLPEEYDTALAGMKDMIFHSYLRPEDVEHERKVITQEAWNKFQNKKFLEYCREYIKNIFYGHDHARFATSLGWPETIDKISHNDIVSWYKNHYGIGNFFIVLAGAVEEKHIENISLFLKDLPKATENTISGGMLGKPKEKRFIKIADEIGEVKEQVEITIMRINKVLEESRSEIASMSKHLIYDLLHEKLRIDRSLCYNVDVTLWLEKTYSQITMNVKTDEKNIEIVEKEFWNVIEEIQDRKYMSRFETIKKLDIQQVRAQERLSGDIANNVVRDVPRYGRPVTLTEELTEMGNVTYDDVVKFIKETFDPEYVFTEIILPSKK